MAMSAFFVLVVLIANLAWVLGANIDAFGALREVHTPNAARTNGLAFYKALQHANSSVSDRVVTIPGGTWYSFMPHTSLEDVHNVTIQLDGTLEVYADHWIWPNATNEHGPELRPGRALMVMQFERGSHLSFRGTGRINGNGFPWWEYVLDTGFDNRPILLYLHQVSDVLLEDWSLYDSPYYHTIMWDCLNVLVQRVTVKVDAFAQKHLLKSRGHWLPHPDGFQLEDKTNPLHDGLPTFPLNTDGIDIAATNVVVRDCHITNFDDSVCVKPNSCQSRLSTCAQNYLFENITIHFGVGASVGSITPHPCRECIRNITFRNIYWKTPIKAIYVKPNPGNTGYAILDDITYENGYAYRPLMWSIYVSTQQQAQPGNGTHTGCSFFYPLFHTKCPTQPRVPVTNLRLTNITMYHPVFSAGMLRCNASGPCKNWTFTNVNVQTVNDFPEEGGRFLCSAIENFKMVNSTPGCRWQNATEEGASHVDESALMQRVWARPKQHRDRAERAP